jgi:hypothetical protein
MNLAAILYIKHGLIDRFPHLAPRDATWAARMVCSFHEGFGRDNGYGRRNNNRVWVKGQFTGAWIALLRESNKANLGLER